MKEVGPATAPEPPAFDPLTATTFEARIVTVHGGAWGLCGVIHAVGAIEVEVLEVGDPAPRMVLFVSCPADLGNRDLLEVGNVVQVRLFRRKQSWPKPPAELPEGVPVRYVQSLAPGVVMMQGQPRPSPRTVPAKPQPS